VAEAGTRCPRPAAVPASCFGVFTAPGRTGTGAADAGEDTTLTRDAAIVRLNAVESHRRETPITGEKKAWRAIGRQHPSQTR
jgi:hypothetical protein